MPPLHVQRDVLLAKQGDEDARARLSERGRRGGVMSARSRRNRPKTYTPNELWRIWDELKTSP